MTIILASASATRCRMLHQAGIAAVCEAAAIDETTIKRRAIEDGKDVAAAAGILAELKAQRVAHRHPEALVIGADQILECEGVWFDKPASVADARSQLASLCGRTHTLTSAAVIVRDGQVIWRHADTARLTMRAFTDEFLDDYLAATGETVCETVGSYRIEGLGLQLFSRVEGDHFVILGMPLLALLEVLRDLGELKP